MQWQGVEEKKSWADASWAEIAERDPDMIVLVDASWDLAREFVVILTVLTP